jgi:tetratricopeptide (TPR) repeat protein
LRAAAYENLGHALHAANRFAEAEKAYRKALELAPLHVLVHAHFSLTLLAQGRNEEALQEAMRKQEEAYRLWALVLLHHAMDRVAEPDTALRESGEKYADTMAFQVAEAHAARGEADAAFEWLDRAYVQRDPGLSQIKISTLLRSPHGDPRWGTFLKKMGFEE